MARKHALKARDRGFQRTLGWTVIAICAAAGARADTLHVPAQYPTIQAAIDAASPNDIIEVADGTWAGAGNKNLNFQAKAITLRSESGNRELCIIDCEDDGRFATFGAGDTAVVQSITIQNGNTAVSGGAALLNAGSSPSFIDCVFRLCDAFSLGGALRVSNASVTINRCVFQDNTAFGRGGAIYASGASVALVDTEFDGNQAQVIAGGMYISGGEVTISGCSFAGNSANAGGGLRVGEGARLTCTDSSFTGNSTTAGGGAGILGNEVDPASRISDCQFTANVADGGGAGVGFDGSSDFPEISNCIFQDNVAAEGAALFFRGANTTRVENVLFLNNTAFFGGGVEISPGNSPEFVNCLFAGNSAITPPGNPPAGGAIDIFGAGSNPTMVNCTFSDNSSEAFGGAVTVSQDAHLQLVNSVLWGNAAPTGPEIRISYPPPFEGGTVTVFYSDVEGGEAGVSVGNGGTLNWGAGNIDEDPLFVDRPNGDYRLSAGSPCIDFGDPAMQPPGGRDLDGNMRVWNGRVDMGCYEFGSFVFGDLNCDDAFNGGDIDPFFLALGDPAAYATQFPNCDPLLGDMNADGLFNGGDIDPFFTCLGGGQCP